MTHSGRLMRRVLRVAAGVAFSGLIIMAVTLVGMLVGIKSWLRTQAGHEYVRQGVEKSIATTVPGFRLGGVDLSTFGDIVLRDIEITDIGGRPAISVDRLHARVSIPALLRGRLHLKRLFIEGPRLHVAPTPSGGLNLTELMLPNAPPSVIAGWPIDIDEVEVHTGTVSYTRGDQTLSLDDVTAVGSVQWHPERVAAVLTLAAAADASGRRLNVEMSGTAEYAFGAVDVRLQRLELRGALPSGTVVLAGNVQGTWPDLSVHITGTLPDAATARLNGSVRATRTPTYELTVAITALNPRMLLTGMPVGTVNGALRARGHGLPMEPASVAHITAELAPSRIAGFEPLAGELTADTHDRAWHLRKLAGSAPGLRFDVSGRGEAREFSLSTAATFERRCTALAAQSGVCGTGQVDIKSKGVFDFRRGRVSFGMLRANARGSNLASAGVSVAALRAQVTADGELRRLRGRTVLRVEGLRVHPNAPPVDQLELSFDHKANTFHVHAAASARNARGSLVARGEVTAEAANIDLNSLQIDFGTFDVRLLREVAVQWTLGRGVHLRGVRFAILGTTIEADGLYETPQHAPPRIRAQVVVPRLEIAALGAIIPHLRHLKGSLSGTAIASGDVYNPTVSASVRIADATVNNVSFPHAEAALLYSSARLHVELAARQLSGGTLQATLDHSSSGALAARLTARYLDLTPLQSFVPVLNESHGRLDADVAVSTDGGPHELNGHFVVYDGTFAAPSVPKLSEVQASVRLEGESVRIERLDAMAGTRGRLSMSGWLRLGSRKLVPTAIHLHVVTKNLPLAQQALPGASLNVDFVASGTTRDDQLDVSLLVNQGSLQIPHLETGRHLQSTDPLPGVYFVDKRPATTKTSPGRALPFSVRLAISAKRFNVRGETLQANFGAQLAIRSRNRETTLAGSIEAEDGSVRLFGNQYSLTRARALWSGAPNPNPELDIRMTRQFPEALVTVLVTGEADEPKLDFRSDPPIYSKDQMVSLVLTGRAGESTAEGGAMQNAISAISTAIVGNLAQRIAPALPIDIIRVERLPTAELGQQRQQASLPGTPSSLATLVELGKYVTPRIRVSYVHVFGATADENSNETLVDYQLTHSLLLRVALGDAGAGLVDLLWSKRY